MQSVRIARPTGLTTEIEIRARSHKKFSLLRGKILRGLARNLQQHGARGFQVQILVFKSLVRELRNFQIRQVSTPFQVGPIARFTVVPAG